MKLGLFAAIIIGALLFLGYTRNADDTISLTTPKGWASPIPLEKGSWKEKLAGIDKHAEEEESVLILEMAHGSPLVDKPVAAPRPAVSAKPKMAKKKYKRMLRVSSKAKRRPLKRTALR